VVDDEVQAAEQAAGGRGADERADAAVVMDLLAEHVPLTLLADLAVAEPRSEAILRAEGLPDDAWWEDDPEASGPPADRPAGAPVPEDAVPVDPDAAADPRPA
jgi:hypothetical protein